jgi:hypothetical protein
VRDVPVYVDGCLGSFTCTANTVFSGLAFEVTASVPTSDGNRASAGLEHLSRHVILCSSHGVLCDCENLTQITCDHRFALFRYVRGLLDEHLRRLDYFGNPENEYAVDWAAASVCSWLSLSESDSPKVAPDLEGLYREFTAMQCSAPSVSLCGGISLFQRVTTVAMRPSLQHVTVASTRDAAVRNTGKIVHVMRMLYSPSCSIVYTLHSSMFQQQDSPGFRRLCNQ